MNQQFNVGDIVEYTFRTIRGDEVRPGLISGCSAGLGANVWEVLGFDGEEYKIHADYLAPLKRKKIK